MHSATILGALSLALPALCLPPAPYEKPANAPLPLKPIHVADFESAFGVRRRASEKLSSLDLQTQEQLIYGRPGGDGQLILANMTLYADDGLPLVLMERFEGHTKSVDCKGDDGTMSLTFNSQEAFQYALKTWDFINHSKEKKFLLIANHDGCGPDDERQPYLITNIREDVPTLTTYLTAQVAKWSEVAATWDLDFGHTVPQTQASGSNSRRSLLDKIQGNGDYTKSASFPVAVGTPNTKTTILDTAEVKIDCDNCYVTGNFALAGRISLHHFVIQELLLTAAPAGVAAELLLGTTITASANPSPLSYEKTLFTAPIPDAGIAIKGIFSLGATISYDVGVTASFSGSATVQYGLRASLPDSALLVADLKDPFKSSATGFESSKLEPTFNVSAFSAGLTLGAYSQPKLSFGIEIIEVAKFEADFSLKLPEVTATLAGGYNANGFCPTGGSKTGVNLSSTVGVEVDFDLNGDLAEDKHNFTKKLYGTNTPLGAACFPVNIPGLGPSNATPSPPSALSNATPSAPSGPSNATLSAPSGPSNATASVPSGPSFATASAPSGVALQTNTVISTPAPRNTTVPSVRYGNRRA